MNTPSTQSQPNDADKIRALLPRLPGYADLPTRVKAVRQRRAGRAKANLTSSQTIG